MLTEALVKKALYRYYLRFKPAKWALESAGDDVVSVLYEDMQRHKYTWEELITILRELVDLNIEERLAGILQLIGKKRRILEQKQKLETTHVRAKPGSFKRALAKQAAERGDIDKALQLQAEAKRLDEAAA